MANVQLLDGKVLNVNETAGAIQDAVTGLGPVITPMIRLTEIGSDRPVLVFASNILWVKDQGQ